MSRLDLTGERFGRLIVLRDVGRYNGGVLWLCECDCGRLIRVASGKLREGVTKSCGCWRRDNMIKMNKERSTHGMFNTPIYRTWNAMLQRCENPNNTAYKWYGERGIFVCERWHKFENFLEDMGPRPEGKSIDRWPDNEGNYELGNCRWATSKEQVNNQRVRKDQLWFLAWHKDMMCQFISNNQSEFARNHRLIQSGISACLLNKCKQHKGWKFRWILNSVQS